MKRFLGRDWLAAGFAIGWFSLATPSACGQIAAWLDFDGAIPGDATDARHPKWIEIRSFSVDARRTAGSPGGQAGGGIPTLSEISLSKQVDRASSRLFVAAVAGNKPLPRVTLDLNSGPDQPLMRLELENVLLSQQSGWFGGTDKATESISLRFEKITFISILPDSGTIFSSYDLRTGEVNSGTGSTTNPDSDSDGLPDSWEMTYGLSVGTNDAAGDADGDALSNLHEFQLGTNPKSGTSFFKAVLTPGTTAPGTFDISWNSVPGKTYIIEWSPDLVTKFTAVRTVTAAGATTTENLPRSGTLGFFRVRPQ